MKIIFIRVNLEAEKDFGKNGCYDYVIGREGGHF